MSYDVNADTRREIQEAAKDDEYPYMDLFILSEIGIRDGSLIDDKRSKYYLSDSKKEEMRNRVSMFLKDIEVLT